MFTKSAFTTAISTRLKKFRALLTNEVIPVTDYSDIPLCITWARGLSGAEELGSTLRAHGFKVEHSKHTTVAWAPLGWTQYIDHEDSVRFLDETGTLRAIRKRIDDNLPEMMFFTRLEYGRNVRTGHYYLYDRQSGKTLNTCTSLKKMGRWIAQHYPQYADPTAYRGRSLTPNPQLENLNVPSMV
jgi:hypothetical protein